MKNAISSYLESKNIPVKTIKNFEYYYNLLIKGSTGFIPDSTISPPSTKNLILHEDLENQDMSSLDKVAVIKLNGGLGTSMGLDKAKSLLQAKDNLTFLDILCLQILNLRVQTKTKIPLLLMNSFNTKSDSLNFIREKHSAIILKDIPIDFTQSRFPRIKKSNFQPLTHPNDELNWNPPGHGDIYSSLLDSGILDKLINTGIEYIFISNSDNLGASLDCKILNFLIDNNISFLMEVCIRTEMDKKGGHLAESNTNVLTLREIAQCPKNDINHFQNIQRYKYFNTNNLWINLKVLKQLLNENDGILNLPMIVNPKNIEGTEIYQLETAMGAAISLFNNSKALVVPRSRFIPVKKTNDLLILRSDFFKLNEDYTLEKTEPNSDITVDLDERFYKKIEQFDKMFSKGSPSLKNCTKLNVEGKIQFGSNVNFSGSVSLKCNDNHGAGFLDNIEIKTT